MQSIQLEEVSTRCSSPANRSIGAAAPCSTSIALAPSDYHLVTNGLSNQTVNLTRCSQANIGQSTHEENFIVNNIEEVAELLSDCESSVYNENDLLCAFIGQPMGTVTQVDSLDTYLTVTMDKIRKEMSQVELAIQKTFINQNLPYTQEDYYALTVRNNDLYGFQSSDLAFRVESIGLLNFFYYNIDALSCEHRELAALLILTLNSYGKMNIIAQDEYAFIDGLTEISSGMTTDELQNIMTLAKSLASKSISIDEVVKQLNEIDKDIIEVLTDWHCEIDEDALNDLFNKVTDSLERNEHLQIYSELEKQLQVCDHLTLLSQKIKNLESSTIIPNKKDMQLYTFVRAVLPVLNEYFLSNVNYSVINPGHGGDIALGYDLQFIGSDKDFEEASVQSVDQHIMETGEPPADGLYIADPLLITYLKQLAVTTQVLHGLSELNNAA